MVKVNIVLIFGINNYYIEEVVVRVKVFGVKVMNIMLFILYVKFFDIERLFCSVFV